MPKDRITPPTVRFFPLREKIVDNFTSLRDKATGGHVPPVIPVFPRSRPSSPRYKMMSPRDKFTSPNDTVGNKLVFSMKRVVDMERSVRCIITPRVSPGQRRHVVYHKKFSQTFLRLGK